MDQYSAITYSEAVGQISIELNTTKSSITVGCNCLLSCQSFEWLIEYCNLINIQI